MILTVTLNAALDVTYPVPALLPHASHRVEDVRARAGGKGTNVARVLHGRGESVLATGLLGGATGGAIRAGLDTAGIAHAFVSIAGESRRTVAVVAADTGDATIFNERGPEVTATEWASLLRTFDTLVARASVVVASGSLPVGVATDAYAELVRRAAPVPVIVDCEGPALLAAAAAGAAVVKPNRAEVRTTTGLDDPVAGGRALLAAGAGAVVVSLGSDGLLGLTGRAGWRATAGERLAGNPTGAGDACVAALAAGWRRDLPWPERLRTAVAWSAGAVVAPLAGDIDAATCERILDAVHIEETHATHTDR